MFSCSVVGVGGLWLNRALSVQGWAGIYASYMDAGQTVAIQPQVLFRDWWSIVESDIRLICQHIGILQGLYSLSLMGVRVYHHPGTEGAEISLRTTAIADQRDCFGQRGLSEGRTEKTGLNRVVSCLYRDLSLRRFDENMVSGTNQTGYVSRFEPVTQG